MRKKAIIFDLDNTLVRCSDYYADAKHKFADMMSLETGIPQGTAIEILKSIDLENLKMKGVIKKRYPQSFVAACAAIEVIMEKPHSKSRARKAWSIGNGVFKAPYPLYDGVYSALELIKSNGYAMFLCTKGDSQVQLRKIVRNKLRNIFPESHIYIDATKEAEHFCKIIKDHGLDPRYTINVGDSLKDDVGVAKQVGIKSVHVTGQQVTWGYEDKSYNPDYSIHDITELPGLLDDIFSSF